MRKDFSYQGKLYAGTRRAGGGAGALQDLGDAPKCALSLTNETEKRKESRTGQRLTSAVMDKGKEATIALTLNWDDLSVLALALYGKALTIASGSVTAETFDSGLEAGDFIRLEHGGVSAVAITDSTPVTPLVLVEGTDYRIDSANGGVLEILDPTGFVQPLKAAYTHTAAEGLTMFSEAPPERYLFLDGIDTMKNLPVRVDLYRVKFNPAANFDLIHEGMGSLEITGEVLMDEDAAEDSDLGPFGRVKYYAAAP